MALPSFGLIANADLVMGIKVEIDPNALGRAVVAFVTHIVIAYDLILSRRMTKIHSNGLPEL